ncbi:AI-2E family transporter [Sharpea azabuensis]|uniref:Predicted PurR-regulated permease PerM n=1 Tax=Sharpea azabuensis TaxID=322505 RepID=A0A1H6RRU1_9FIRM|nr:AI-2E family transporter [Sharpea azabuensis]SEI53882.1 Predicted PurR-regulated permease PerM [Sharpea azabuensis]
MQKYQKYIPIAIVAFIFYLATLYWKSFVSLLGAIIKASSAIIIGLLMAYVVNILMIQFEKLYQYIFKKKYQKAKRPLCIILSYLSVVALFGLLVAIIVPQIIDATELLLKNSFKALSPYLNNLSKYPQLRTFITPIETFLSDLSKGSLSSTSTDMLKHLFTGASGLLSNMTKVLSSIAGIVATLFFGFMFSLYLLGSKEILLAQLNRVLKTYLPKAYPRISYVAHVFNESIKNFVIGQVTEALIIGVLAALGCTILRFPYALMVGAIIGTTALIPVLGAYLGALVSAFLIFTISPVKAIQFLIFIVILQQFEDNLIYPRVVGTSLGLPGIWVLASITVFGGVFGFGGVIFGVPITSALYTLLRNDLHRRMKQRRKEVITSEE